ncbi:Hypothetical protein SLIV_24642 [Streptomyces lividans TK24]|uniref:Uncharacterized protein n=1 Tax=Streptomyces lividans TK24 TaxID=457428 RepID=A0ABX6TPE9_STRLI|nr:Hypothetical protein SLIV_24642 [Streptomyces lividans TK24]QSJ12026.1 Hypothetical protein SLIVDG2_27642 [Streptomyces lividans]QTD72936.1 Hypothetical protein SLIVYQS_24642 [Streptomyces lividans TK24] [Streptomyces lividans]
MRATEALRATEMLYALPWRVQRTGDSRLVVRTRHRAPCGPRCATSPRSLAGC